MDAAKKLQKEQFVSNLTGTNVLEIDQLLVFQPLLVLLLSSICLFISNRLSFSRHYHYRKYSATHRVRELIISLGALVLPLLFLLTIFSDYIYTACTVAFVSIVLLLAVSGPIGFISPAENSNTIEFEIYKDYVTWYRAYVNILVSICILAVDFKVYPRRFGKVETFGTGLMDIFVGSYIMCNALVCREARKPSHIPRSFFKRLFELPQTIWSCLPLVMIGSLRLIMTKSANYQEHVTEYGTHWNFFFTLAAVKILCSAAYVIIPPTLSLVLAASTGLFYQHLLSHNLQNFILQPGARDTDLITANREGVFSVLGYMSLYFAGAAVGGHIFSRNRVSIKECSRLLVTLLTTSLSCYYLLKWCESEIDPVSRRLANLSFILWTIHHSLLVLGLMLAVCIVQHLTGAIVLGQNVDIKLPLMDAIKYNSLLYFLLANVLTGFVNFAFDTLDQSPTASLAIISVYLFVLNAIIQILYEMDMKTKFW